MTHAVYSLIVSMAYALLWMGRPSVAEALVVAFVALLVVPALHSERKRWQR